MNEGPSGCCGVVHGCVFAKALLAHAARCECAGRRQSGEATVIDCHSPVAHHNCETLFALLAERGRFALRLPPASRPMLHAQAMRLQCGGVAALREHLRGAENEQAAEDADVHRLVQAAHERHRSLADLPWAELVPRMQAWTPRRRGAQRP
jgi:hypothetical protein